MSKPSNYVIKVNSQGFPLGVPTPYDSSKGREVGEVYSPLSVEGLRFVNGVWVKQEGAVDPTPEPIKITLTPLQLRRLFTFDEKVALEEAIRQGNSAVKVLMDDLAAAEFVDLSDPLVITGLQLLVQQDFLTQERADQILANEAPDA